jgi:matrix metalloproteinase-14 (membrane-inserted)
VSDFTYAPAAKPGQVNRAALRLLAVPARRRPRRYEAPTEDRRAAKFAACYLDAFGYLETGLENEPDQAALVRALSLFQYAAHVPVHGMLCPRTLRAMEAPRCGCPDVVRPRPRHDRYRAIRAWAQQMQPVWTKRHLRYAVAAYVDGVPAPVQDQVLATAFGAWTRLGNIEAEPTTDLASADVVIGTGAGPASNFDGPGGVLAWAYMPDGSDRQLQLRFDQAESWTASAAERGTALLNVATHEVGHALGLTHSAINTALMAPFYSAAVAAPQPSDDVPRFQNLYGVRVATAPAPAPVPPATPGATAATTRIAVEGAAYIWVNGTRVLS